MQKRRHITGLIGFAVSALIMSSCYGPGGEVSDAPKAPETETTATESTEPDGDADEGGEVPEPTEDNVPDEDEDSDEEESEEESDDKESDEESENESDKEKPEEPKVLPPVKKDMTPPPAEEPDDEKPAEPKTPSVPNGTSPLDITINVDAGSQQAVNNFGRGITQCEGLMESILVRDDADGSSDHTINLNVQNLNGNSTSRTRTAGRAQSPSADSYEFFQERGLTMTLDQGLANQYNVCTTFIHEALHTLTVAHVGQGLMAPIISNDPFIDKPIADQLSRIGYSFIPAIEQQLAQNKRITISELLVTYTDTNSSQLATQSA